MQEALVRKKIDELIEAVSLSHISRIAKAIGEDGVYLPEGAQQGADTEEALDLLGLRVKYLLFDLEATRRENRYLRQMLESRPPRRKDDEESDGPDTF
jgi:hypothetical protein